MAKFRTVKSSFWTDSKVVEVFSPEDKYFFLYLLTNPKATQLGIYEFVPKLVAFDMGYSVEAIKVLLDRFENKYGVIKYSKETGEIAIKNYLLHSVVKGGKPVMDCLKKEEKMIKDKSLLEYVANNVYKDKRLNTTVKEFFDDVMNIEDEDEDDNEDDNDNERIVAYDSLKLKEMVISESVPLPDRGQFQCEWCGNKVSVLENHHFPIPKKMYGKETVHICHDCHKAFHDLEYSKGMGTYRTSTKDIDDLADEMFYELWNLYPKKRGKGSVSQTQRRKLYHIGYEQLVRCIDRYIEETKGLDEQYIKNGSTFFNSGYVDYLDENYEPPRNSADDALRRFLQEG